VASVLGIEVDTVHMTIRMQQPKRFSCALMVATAVDLCTLGFLPDEGFLTKIAGKLENAAMVAPDGRSDLPPIWNAAYKGDTLSEHPLLLASLTRWLARLSDPVLSEERLILMLRVDQGLQLRLRSDASGEFAAGLIMGHMMGWWRWDPTTSTNGLGGLRIREQELLPYLEFARDFVAPGWFAGMMIDYVTDNESNAYVINKGRCRHAAVNQMVGESKAHHRTGNAGSITSFGPREGNEASDDMSNAKGRASAHAVACKYLAGIPLILPLHLLPGPA
jgi:hypothetical protein